MADPFTVMSIFLYVSETWTLTAELKRRIQVTETRCYRNVLHIPHTDRFTNEEAMQKSTRYIVRHEDITCTVRRSKLVACGNVTRCSRLQKPSSKAQCEGTEGEAYKKEITYNIEEDQVFLYEINIFVFAFGIERCSSPPCKQSRCQTGI